jgi:hypothetical protein
VSREVERDRETCGWCSGHGGAEGAWERGEMGEGEGEGERGRGERDREVAAGEEAEALI